MRFTQTIIFFVSIPLITATDLPARAAEPVLAASEPALILADLPERTCGGGRFMFVDRVPVLCVSGDPAAIGRQTAVLLGSKAQRLLEYPRRLLDANDKNAGWTKLVARSRELWKNAPADHRREMDSFIAVSGVDRDLILVGNLMMDIYRGLGCASLVVEPPRSKTGEALFGRNLDFYGGGILHKFTVVTVCRPRGKHAFATVGFAGLLGCLTGINDAGLVIAVHEVIVARDGSRLFNSQGIPYTFALRRILEECATADEAEKLLRGMERTTKLSLAVCDREKSCVLEMTPKSVVRRNSQDGVCICTNHFRSPQLSIFPFCGRYAALETARKLEKIGLDDVVARMHAANSGSITLQTMVFKPRSLRLHLAAGNLPASVGPFHTIDLQPLLVFVEAGKAKKHKTFATAEH